MTTTDPATAFESRLGEADRLTQIANELLALASEHYDAAYELKPSDWRGTGRGAEMADAVALAERALESARQAIRDAR